MENDYIILLHNLDAGASVLLGEFNDADKYVVADELKEELAKANKLITDYKEDKITAKANVGSYTFDFNVYVQLGEQNKKRVSLFLIEKCKLGFVEKELLTLVKSVVIDGNQNLMQVLKKEFAMFIRDESEGIDMANANLKAILNRKLVVGARSKFLLGELYDADKAYVLKMLSLIKGSGSYGTKILAQFKMLLSKANIGKNDPKYWNTLKNILDKLVMENSLLFGGKVQETMNEMQRGYRDLVLKTKEKKQEASKAKGKSKDKPKKKKPGEAFSGLKFEPFKEPTPFKFPPPRKPEGGRPRRGHVPPGSAPSRISSDPSTNRAVFEGLMSPIYLSNLERSSRRRGRESSRREPTPTPPSTTGPGVGMERI